MAGLHTTSLLGSESFADASVGLFVGVDRVLASLDVDLKTPVS